MPSLSRDALLVKFFAQARPGVPLKPLAKFIYESDVLAREYLGHPISSFTYRRNHFGPYDDTINDVIQELIDAGHAEQRKEYWLGSQGEVRIFHLFAQQRQDTFDFEPGQMEVLRYVVKNFIDMPFQDFMNDIIYQTEPWKADVPFGKPLPMEMLDNAGTRRVGGFKLEEILRAEEAVRRGEVVTLGAFMDELRTKIRA
jgi:hypothetical protein